MNYENTDRHWDTGHQKHSMDLAFALALFAVFAVSSMLLVLLGARVYGRIAENTNQADAPVILSYLTEKLRGVGSRTEVSLGDGDSLQMEGTGEVDGYVTWIYQEDGFLKETLIPEGQEPIPGTGNEIAKIQSFEVKEPEAGLLELWVEDASGEQLMRYYSFRHR